MDSLLGGIFYLPGAEWIVSPNLHFAYYAPPWQGLKGEHLYPLAIDFGLLLLRFHPQIIKNAKLRGREKGGGSK